MPGTSYFSDPYSVVVSLSLIQPIKVLCFEVPIIRLGQTGWSRMRLLSHQRCLLCKEHSPQVLGVLIWLLNSRNAAQDKGILDCSLASVLHNSSQRYWLGLTLTLFPGLFRNFKLIWVTNLESATRSEITCWLLVLQNVCRILWFVLYN